MLPLRRPVVALLFLLLTPVLSGAQVLEPPPRLYRGLFGGGPPPDPTRSRQDFGISGSLFGGYDDSLVPPYGGFPVVPYPAGYTGFWDAGARYWIGSERQSLEVRGRGFMNTYRNVGVGANYGTEEAVRGRRNFGRKATLEVTQDYRSDPYLTLGLFGLIQGFDVLGTPDAQPTNAVTVTRSRILNATAFVTERWSRRTRTDFGISYNNQHYEGIAFDRNSYAPSFAFERDMNRSTSLVAAYRLSDSQFTDATGLTLPMLDQRTEVGFRYKRNLSKTRQLTYSFGAGPQHVSFGDAGLDRGRYASFWAPSGYGTIRWDFGRSWGLSGDFKHAAAVLQGIAPYPYMTTAVLVTAGGFLNRWLEGVVSTGYSNGQTGQAVGGQVMGSYDGFASSVQGRVRLSRFWSAVASYHYYKYYSDAITSLTLGVPRELQRNAIRVGVAWSVPLVGSYLAQPPDAPVNIRD